MESRNPLKIKNYFFSISVYVSFCMFQCSKGHSVRAYLDTTQKSLLLFFFGLDRIQIVAFNQYKSLSNTWMIIDKLRHSDAVAEGAIARLLGLVIQCVFGSGQNVRDL